MESKEKKILRKKRKLFIMGSIHAILGIIINLFCPNLEVFLCYGLFIFVYSAIIIWGFWKIKQREKEEEEDNSVSDYYPK